MNNELWGSIVWLIHKCFTFFMLLAPFSKNKEYVIMHAILVPFLFFHWLTNNDTCALTELEKFLTKKNKNTDTYIGSIISPIYKLEDRCQIKKLKKIVALIMWGFTLEIL